MARGSGAAHRGAILKPTSEKPILMSGPMVIATLADLKHQTRRVIKPQPYKPDSAHDIRWEPAGMLCYEDYFRERAPSYCPYGKVGSRIWVRESHFIGGIPGESEWAAYRADEPENKAVVWRPSIFMPKWASRITLEITGVRVERVQEISEDDQRAEGIVVPSTWEVNGRKRTTFGTLWDSINDRINYKRGYGWDVNPWLWVLEYKRVEVARE